MLFHACRLSKSTVKQIRSFKGRGTLMQSEKLTSTGWRGADIGAVQLKVVEDETRQSVC
jgi:hypothetical protein